MEHIGKALGEFIKDSKIEKGLEQNKAIMIWPDLALKLPELLFERVAKGTPY